MVILLSLILLAALPGAACGCGAENGIHDCLTYQRAPARASLSGRLCGMEFAAVLTLGEWSGEAGSSRDFRLEYTAPEAMSGISVLCEGGVYAASCGSVSIPGDEAVRLALPALAFCLNGEVVAAGAEKKGGTPVTVVELRAVRSPGFDGADAHITVDSGAGTPCLIALSLPDGREMSMEVGEYTAGNT